MTNFLVTGRPGVGKTTLIMSLIEELKLDAGGFYTKEIRRGAERIGFEIITLDGERRILASIELKSPYRVGKYGVNLKDLEEVAASSLRRALGEKELIVVDEIGKMENFSPLFRSIVVECLDSNKKVLGVIKAAGDEFIDSIKGRPDTLVLSLTRANFPEVEREIRKGLKKPW